MNHQNRKDLGIVFFPGAGLDNWIWEPLFPYLPAAVCPINLPGRGRLASVATKPLSVQGYVDHLVPQLEALGPRRLVFVCHSVGAILGQLCAQRLVDRVHGIVHLAAVIPKPGTSFCGSLPFPANLILPLVLSWLGTRPPERAIRDTLCRGVSKDLADRVVGQFCPESKHLYLDPVDCRTSVRTLGYIVTNADQSLDPRRQRQFARRAGIETIESLDAGHLAMLQSPQRLGELISTMIGTAD